METKLRQAMITIYTDGSCTPNPGTGVCAFIAIRDGQELYRDVNKYEDSTNNRMELMAVINAIKWYGSTKSIEPIKIVTDSQYVKNGITDWILKWQKNGWKGSGGKNVLNKQYWVELDELNRNYQIVWEWTKGHTDNKWNNEVDKLCTAGYSKESTSGKEVLPLIQQKANSQRYYLVPAEYLESNEPDLFENGAQAACEALGAIMIETDIPLKEIIITKEGNTWP